MGFGLSITGAESLGDLGTAAALIGVPARRGRGRTSRGGGEGRMSLTEGIKE